MQLFEQHQACTGGSLWKSATGGGSNPPLIEKTTATVAMLWHQLLTALDYLHSLLIMHCDVKPDNILIQPTTLHLYLFDVGLGKKGSMQDGVLHVGRTGCTPAYAGPEVLSIYRKEVQGTLDVASHDLFSAALTVFRTVYQEQPWSSSGGSGAQSLAAYSGMQMTGKLG
jgi:serine/threonine protein kinase